MDVPVRYGIEHDGELRDTDQDGDRGRGSGAAAVEVRARSAVRKTLSQRLIKV